MSCHATVSRPCRVVLAILLGPLSACAYPRDAFRDSVPSACPHWSLDVVAPTFMEAWVEDLEVLDDRGYWVQVPQGMAAGIGRTVGWPPPERAVGGGGARLESTGAPTEVVIRWQSLAEPQTYTWHFAISATLGAAMAKKESVVYFSKAQLGCRSDITVGVAPGGRTIVWISGVALSSIEIMRGQAAVEPLGPYQGHSKGKYRPMHELARKYVDDHGIPFGSWDD